MRGNGEITNPNTHYIRTSIYKNICIDLRQSEDLILRYQAICANLLKSNV